MDIRKWLDHTISPLQHPSLPDQLGLPPFLRPRGDVDELYESGRRRRKRSTSDSSILKIGRRRRRDPPAECESERDHAGSCSDTPTPSHHSSASSPSSRRYARRPRRKTRLERYEPKQEYAKERGKHPSGGEKSAPRKSRRKSRHQKETRGGGLVQSFRAKNVPQDRLTVCCSSYTLLLWVC